MRKENVSILIICIFIHFTGAGQHPERSTFIKSLEVTAGTKIRVTPIYLSTPFEGFFLYQFTPMEQPDLHLSGLGSFFLDEKLKLSNSLHVLFHQSVRRDFLVEHFKLGPDYPYVSEGIEKRIIYDFYTHILYDLRKNKNSKLYLSAGFGYSGV